MTIAPDDVLDFWFSETDPDNWFERSDAFDAELRARFGAAVASARDGGLADWHDTPRGCLALIILIDQFSRNIYRDSPEAWSADPVALSCMNRAIDRNDDATLNHDERKFLYMPLMHSEALADQERCVALFRDLADEGAEDGELALAFAIRHHEIIERFGRFPHRNQILGRDSTPEEIAFLEEPNSAF